MKQESMIPIELLMLFASIISKIDEKLCIRIPNS